jgi:hypothetical protein
MRNERDMFCNHPYGAVVIAAAIVVGGTLMFAAQPAEALVINFSPLAQAGAGFNSIGDTYSQDGFTFTGSAQPEGSAFNYLGTWGSSDPDHPIGGSNTTSLMPYYQDTLFTITPNSGTFDLKSVDLAQWGFDQLLFAPSFSVTFDGVVNGGGLVSQTFSVSNLAGSPVLSTYAFSGFTNLTQVSVVEGTYDLGTAWQLDNLCVGSGTCATPLPSTWAMLIAGFVGLGFLAYRGTKKSAAAIAAA